jgi:hypothetical protein
MLGVLHNNTLVAWGKNQPDFQESMIPTIYRELLFKDVAAAMATSYILT